MIAISISTDWAPIPVIKDTLELIKEHDVPVTVFCTDDLSEKLLLPMLDGMNVELAIHPNITNESYIDSTIKIMRNKFPRATGSRSHRFFTSSPLFRALSNHGFLYNSSVPIMDKQIEPYKQIEGITEIPVNWSDDIMIKGKMSDKTFRSTLIVMNFHPVHIYINSCSEKHYLNAKEFYMNPDELIKHRHEGFGIRSIFKEALNMDSEFVLMRDLLD